MTPDPTPITAGQYIILALVAAFVLLAGYAAAQLEAAAKQAQRGETQRGAARVQQKKGAPTTPQIHPQTLTQPHEEKKITLHGGQPR